MQPQGRHLWPGPRTSQVSYRPGCSTSLGDTTSTMPLPSMAGTSGALPRRSRPLPPLTSGLAVPLEGPVPSPARRSQLPVRTLTMHIWRLVGGGGEAQGEGGRERALPPAAPAALHSCHVVQRDLGNGCAALRSTAQHDTAQHGTAYPHLVRCYHVGVRHAHGQQRLAAQVVRLPRLQRYTQNRDEGRWRWLGGVGEAVLGARAMSNVAWRGG